MQWGRHLKWLDSNGGPLVVVPIENVSLWHGIDTATDSISSDYELACAIDDYLALIRTHPANPLILGGEPLATAWYQDDTRQLSMFVRWGAAPNEEAVQEALQTITLDNFMPTAIQVNWDTHQLMLFDSTYTGSELDKEGALPIFISPNVYELDTMNYEKDDIWLIIHRLRPIN